ncbi:hypothetical protein Tco_1098919 [Tanacetum coccineum]
MISSSFLHFSSLAIEKWGFSNPLCRLWEWRYLKCRNEASIYRIRDVYAVTIEVEQLTKDFQAKADKEAPNSSTSIGHCKEIFSENDAPISKKKYEGASGILPCQLPPKKLSLGSFTLPCTIGSLNKYALADLVEMVDVSKKAPMGIVENVLVKIDKFVFLSNVVVIDMLRDPNETMILGSPQLLEDPEDKSLKDRRDKFEWIRSSTYPPEVKLS